MPLPLGLLLAGAGLVLLAASRWRRTAWLLAVGGLATILLAALPEVSRTLMAGLERPYPSRPATDCPRAEAIVLLGGALQPLLAGETRGRLHRGSDRAWEAAQLWHAGCAPWVVVSAGGLIEPPVVAGVMAIAHRPMRTGPLEPTNEPYAIAKIAGIKLCKSYNRQHGRDYRSLMPTNHYGPGDNFHPENSHVIPGLLRRFHEAVQGGAERVTIWGTGTPRKLLDVSRLKALGWVASIGLEEGLKDAYAWSHEHLSTP